MNFYANITVGATDVVYDFFDESIAKRYAVIHLRGSEFVIIDKIIQKGIINFTGIEKVPYNNYIIRKTDGTSIIIRFIEEENMNILCSEPFMNVIQVFNLYVVVTLLDKRNALIPLNSWKGFEFTKWVDSWLVPNEQNHVVMDLPNVGKRMILLKRDLTTIPYEYDMIYELNNPKVNNIFRIAKKKTEGFYVINMETKNISLAYEHISYFGEKWGYEIKVPSSDFVVVKQENKFALMHINDFSISDFYDNITYINSKYAIVRVGEEEKILRLSDFKLAIF